MDRVLDRALRLVGVRTVGELAEGNVRPELDEVGVELARLDPPELELAEAGGVDDVAAGLQTDQLGGGRGVLLFGRPIGHLANAQVEVGG